MRVLFLHGFGSDPNGIRPVFLRSSGHEVTHPALPDHDFDESVRIAQEAFDRCAPEVVVGSSRGGGVAMAVESGDVPLVLIAPSWSKWGGAARVKPNTLILHSAHDEVVPIEGSRQLVRDSGLPEDRLVVVGANHRMVDDVAFMALTEAIERVAKM